MKFKFSKIKLIGILILQIFISTNAVHADTLKVASNTKFEPLPILYYDTDNGFGYGLKAFFLNYLGENESFDILFSRSTKGLQEYNLVFSVPDFELRQGKIYPWAVDLEIDLNKWIGFKFYGVGSQSKFGDEEKYTRLDQTVSLTLSRGFSPVVVGQLGLRYSTKENSNFQNDGRLITYQNLSAVLVYYYSAFIVVRYDTRNSFIHPSNGIVIQGDTEWAKGNLNFNRWALWLQKYISVFKPDVIFAFRIGMQTVNGRNLPVQVLLPVGGNNTLRGFPQDRFLDKTSAVVNMEIRFPVFWRFGGVVGFDAGKVWSAAGKMDLNNWALNPTLGGRFYFDTFIVRVDLGISRKTSGFYLTFGHIF